MDDRNAKLLRPFRCHFLDLIPKGHDLTAISGVNTAEHFHQCRLSRSVFTEQSQHFAAFEVE